MAAGALVIDLTALSSDDDDTPANNVSRVHRASASWAGVESSAKRRKLSVGVRLKKACTVLPRTAAD